MESFMTILPPYVHQYIDKYPPTECFNVLKDLICFAVLYSNDRERINYLSLELLQKGADGAVTHKPYISSGSALSTLSASAPSTNVTSPHYLSPVSVTKAIPFTVQQQHSSEQLDFECSTILEEQGVLDSRHMAGVDMDHILSPNSVPATHSTTADAGRKSTMPYTFPEWWAHPDSGSNDGLNDYAGKNIARFESPISSNEQKVSDDTPKQLTTTQKMNITNWIPSKL
ncbi:hypothetical protein BCR42DRAFT_413956 [Absidia repens]|uniref:Uncharacterized protein n=1 Tax=Absidia repens TaxID=90262 RepID=A0A1X2IID9_9FUNG|nr:hypothetical protein BCR42DRAFT_413956 [Absidia repens]